MKEKETKVDILSSQLAEERSKYLSENETHVKNLMEKTALAETLKQELADQKGENVVMKRKLELSLRVSRIFFGMNITEGYTAWLCTTHFLLLKIVFPRDCY